MNLKRWTPLLIATLTLAAAGAGFGQAATKIAVVNSQQAFETSAEGKRVAAQLQDRENKIKSDLQKRDDAIRALENRIATGRVTMTQEALANLQADLDKAQTDRKRYEEDSGREYQQAAQATINRLRGEMVAIVEAISRERGFDLVLDLMNSGVVYRNQAIDITDEVVKRYDASKTGAPAAPVKK